MGGIDGLLYLPCSIITQFIYQDAGEGVQGFGAPGKLHVMEFSAENGRPPRTDRKAPCPRLQARNPCRQLNGEDENAGANAHSHPRRKKTLTKTLPFAIIFVLVHGEMAERLKALVLKTSDVERHRGFESLSLRQLTDLWRSTQVAEGAPLLRE